MGRKNGRKALRFSALQFNAYTAHTRDYSDLFAFIRVYSGLLISAHKVTLADFNAIVAQDCVGSGDVEEKLWQTVLQ